MEVGHQLATGLNQEGHMYMTHWAFLEREEREQKQEKRKGLGH